MEINKQLFEDVLSGKLKGTFVLKNGKKFSDNLFTDIYNATVVVGKTTYYFNGKPIVSDYNGVLDIIDFIPDTNMKENELTIEIPDGKTVDWDESKKQIVLRDKQPTYVKICMELFDKDYYFIDHDGSVEQIFISNRSTVAYKNNASTKHQLECLLAKNQLANVAKYLNGEWKPNKGDHVFTLTFHGDFENSLMVGIYYFGTGENQIIFKTQKAARQAIEILGEETVKLALEPLGI